MKAALAIIFAIAAGVLNAQTPPTFEVASIRPSGPNEHMTCGQYLPGGRFNAAGCPLVLIVAQAYDLHYYQVVGVPKCFHLRVRHEMRDLSALALVVGKTGPKLQEAKDNGRPRGSGGIEWINAGSFRGTNAPISMLVDALSVQLGQPVIDKTYISYPVDFNLRWAPDETVDDTHPSIFTAVQEQLGLKLESQKLPIEVLVIDRVERPTPN